MSIPLIYEDKEDLIFLETFQAKRTERIWIPYNEIISYFCHLSKNLWNQAQYIVLKDYNKFGFVPPYEVMDAILNDRKYYKNPDFDNYHKLPPATSQHIIKIHNKSWKTYLVSKNDYYENPDKDYTGKPNKPGYKKKDGEFILIFTNQQCKIKDGYLIFPKKINKKHTKLGDLKIKVRFNDSYTKDGFDLYGKGDYVYNDGDDNNLKLQEVRIIPQGVGYVVEIVYEREIIKGKYNLDPKIIMSVDLGVENIAAITDNIGSRPIIIKSDILKSENQWYNKRRSELSSIYDRQKIGCFLKKDKNGNIRYLTRKTGHKMEILTDNRNWTILDMMHKLSRYLVEHALYIKAKTIAIGRNPGWKQNINMGRKNNQNFVQIPYNKLIKMVKYKGEEYGINVLYQEEPYTSKCSFLGSESLEHHNPYMGERVHRGLFRCSKGIDISNYIGSKKEKMIDEINADVQGAYNIIRKVDPKFNVLDIMEGVAAHGLVPKRLSISELMIKNYQQLGTSHRLIVGGVNIVKC